MPDESCRHCGGSLTRCTICAECRGAVSMICVECGTRTKEQTHALCFMPYIPQIEETEAEITTRIPTQTIAA